MNLAIDLGTSFTYVGTWYNNKFIPLMYGSNVDRNVLDYGYPTTLQTIPLSSTIKDFECQIADMDHTVHIRCFSGTGMKDIKKNVLNYFKNDSSFNYYTSHKMFSSSDYWTDHSNLVKGTADIAYRAFFEVLLKLTYKAIQMETKISEKDKTLDKIAFCYPIIEGCGADYQDCLSESLLSACKKVKWAEHIKKSDIYILSENQCVPKIVASCQKYSAEQMLFVDIGGATSDYCVKNKDGSVKDGGQNNRGSNLVGITKIDSAIVIDMIQDEDEPFRDNVTPTDLAVFKQNMESGMSRIKIRNSKGEIKEKVVYKSVYDALEEWTEFKKMFESLKSLDTYVDSDHIILSGGGSKISNIKAQAESVFPGRVKTIEELAESLGLKEELTANNGVCFGAALWLNQQLKHGDVEEQEVHDLNDKKTAADKEDVTFPSVSQETIHKEDSEPIEVRLSDDTSDEAVGLGTCDYDVRYKYYDSETKEEKLWLVVSKGTRVEKPRYSRCESLIFYCGSGERKEFGEIRTGKLKEMKVVSKAEYIPYDSNCTDLPLQKCEDGIKLGDHTEEYIGVIACKGKSAMYFIVVTYAKKEIVCGDKTYKSGDRINQAWFSVNPLPPNVLNAPKTLAAYEYAAKRDISPDLADSKYERYQETEKKRKLQEQLQERQQELEKAKDTAISELENTYRACLYKLKRVQWIKKKHLNAAFNNYKIEIEQCKDESTLNTILKEAKRVFRSY